MVCRYQIRDSHVGHSPAPCALSSAPALLPFIKRNDTTSRLRPAAVLDLESARQNLSSLFPASPHQLAPNRPRTKRFLCHRTALPATASPSKSIGISCPPPPKFESPPPRRAREWKTPTNVRIAASHSRYAAVLTAVYRLLGIMRRRSILRK